MVIAVKSLLALENNLKQLLEQHVVQQQQIVELTLQNERQRDEIIRTHAELSQLKEDYKHLETAYALVAENVDAEKRERVKQRITNLIAQVDRALEALKQ